MGSLCSVAMLVNMMVDQWWGIVWESPLWVTRKVGLLLGFW